MENKVTNSQTNKDAEVVKTHKEQMREFAEFIESNNLKKKGDAKNGKQ